MGDNIRTMEAIFMQILLMPTQHQFKKKVVTFLNKPTKLFLHNDGCSISILIQNLYRVLIDFLTILLTSLIIMRTENGNDSSSSWVHYVIGDDLIKKSESQSSCRCCLFLFMR